MPMKSLALLVALLLWSPSVPGTPSVTVTPEEEQNLNHYVQVLQNMLLSVPTKEPSREKKSKSPNNVYLTGLKIPKLKAIITHGEPSNEHDVLTNSITEETATLPAKGFTLEAKKRRTKSTAFWTIKPNNVSVVLRTKEPYIEKEEPDLDDKETEAPKVLPYVTDSVTDSSTISDVTFDRTAVSSSNESHEKDDSIFGEDVPQLSGGSHVENLSLPTTEQHPYTSNNEDILKKISELNAQVRHVPPSDPLNPEYREDIQASRDHLRRSLALAEAAEHKLTKLYESELVPLDRSGTEDNIETVINMLYNSRSKLYEYLNIKYVPPEMKRKVIKVVNILKEILCVRRRETQILIRKLLNNNIKILNLLDIP
ncbi:sperm equatorial segment protein 1 [Choloepus didactylus]|uniref:sperm equatorial segment protein 1 n=1 Tax=Choloepus didactylus TaxID=27675 RepID=UPI0018A0402F|nr:sperm equatorial segment protein 1 [Choloepus didactylus]